MLHWCSSNFDLTCVSLLAMTASASLVSRDAAPYAFHAQAVAHGAPADCVRVSELSMQCMYHAAGAANRHCRRKTVLQKAVALHLVISLVLVILLKRWSSNV